MISARAVSVAHIGGRLREAVKNDVVERDHVLFRQRPIEHLSHRGDRDDAIVGAVARGGHGCRVGGAVVGVEAQVDGVAALQVPLDGDLREVRREVRGRCVEGT